MATHYSSARWFLAACARLEIVIYFLLNEYNYTYVSILLAGCVAVENARFEVIVSEGTGTLRQKYRSLLCNTLMIILFFTLALVTRAYDHGVKLLGDQAAMYLALAIVGVFSATIIAWRLAIVMAYGALCFTQGRRAAALVQGGVIPEEKQRDFPKNGTGSRS